MQFICIKIHKSVFFLEYEIYQSIKKKNNKKKPKETIIIKILRYAFFFFKNIVL